MTYLNIMIKLNNHNNYFIILLHSPFDKYWQNNCQLKIYFNKKFKLRKESTINYKSIGEIYCQNLLNGTNLHKERKGALTH